MKRSRRLLIAFLCSALLMLCILPTLSVHAAEQRDSLAEAVDEINGLPKDVDDRSYGTALYNILYARRLDHYKSPAVQDEIKIYLDQLDKKIVSLEQDSKTEANKTELRGLTLKGLYIGTLAFIYDSNVDKSIESVSVTVTVDYNDGTDQMSVGDYYDYIKNELIKKKANVYFAQTSADAIYPYFTWMFQAIYKAKISLLTPDPTVPEPQREAISDTIATAIERVEACNYLSGVLDGDVLSDGENGLNFKRIYDDLLKSIQFANAQINAKNELSLALSDLLKNTSRYPTGSEKRAKLSLLIAAAISDVDTCTTNEELAVTVAKGKASAILYDEYLDALLRCPMAYLNTDEIKTLSDGLVALQASSQTSLSAAADLAAVERILGETRASSNALLCEGIKTNLTHKATAVSSAIAPYLYLSAADKDAYDARLEEIKSAAFADLSACETVEALFSIQAQTLTEIERLDRDAARAEYEAALAYVKGKGNEYSDTQYQVILAIIAEANQALGEQPSRDQYLSKRDQIIEKVRAIPNLLDEEFSKLSANKESYSAENWSLVEGIYAETKEKLANLSHGESAVELIRKGIGDMKSVRLQVAYTPDKELSGDHPSEYGDNDRYYGSITSPDGIPSDAELLVYPLPKNESAAIADKIMQAAKDDRITDRSGAAIHKDLNRLFKDCYISAGFDLSFAPKENGADYSISVLLPKGTSMDRVIGIVCILEDGSVEYYDLTREGLMIHFETNRFATYYVVNSTLTNLLPLILILSVILMAEIVILSLMYLRRNRRKKASLYSAMTFLSPYFPANGWITVILLGIAILILGGWIAALPIMDRLALKKAKKPVSPKQEKEEKPEEPVEENEEAVLQAVSALPAAEPPQALAEAQAVPVLPSTPTRLALPEAQTPQGLPQAPTLLALPYAAEPVEPLYLDLEFYTGNKKGEINLDTLAEHFEDGERITLNDMKRKRLISKQVGYVKVLGRGQLKKSFIVFAQDFSAEAEEKIRASGGHAIVTHSSAKCAERD